MDWLSPVLIIGIVVVPLTAIVFGRLRGETPATIALDAGGYLLFLLGLSWASNLGQEALIAAGAASLGSLVFTMAGGRRRAEAGASR